MTDKEMAEEYVCNKVDKGNFDLEQFGKAYFSESSMKQAFLAGLKADKNMNVATKWHKVADGDLPTKTGEYWTNIGVLIWDYYADGRYGWHTEFCECCDCYENIDSDEVIAWCEIPKFEKEA